MDTITLEIEKAGAFVEALELPPAPRTRRAGEGVLPAPTCVKRKRQTLIVGSEIVSFVEGVEPENRAIIVNCSLLAQLAANKKVQSHDQVRAWYDAYFDTLTHLGWNIEERGFSEHRQAGTDLEVHQAIISVAAVLLGPTSTAFVAVISTLNAMKKVSSGPWMTIFKRESQAGKAAQFRITIVETDTQGKASISMMAFQLEATNNLVQILFFKFRSAEAKLLYASGKVAINTALSVSLGPIIANKVAAYTHSFVADLAI